MKKVLIICGQEIILKRDDGGKKCCYRNFELFTQVFGQEKVFLMMCSDAEGTSNTNIMRIGSHKNKLHKVINVLRGSFFMEKESEDEILRFIKEEKIDIVIFERSMFGRLITKIKRECSVQTWVFIHNIEKNYFYNKVKYQNICFMLPYLCVAKSEKITMQKIDVIMTLTDRDAKLVKNIYGRQTDMVMPMTFDDCYAQKVQKIKSVYDLQGKKTLLFIGSMFPPNYEGIKWFAQNVMPELNDYTLVIVGKDFEKKADELDKENIKVIGTVDELATYYLGNNVMVMPIMFGDGMKIKTAEAMMYGKMIFATHEALEGYDTGDVEHIYECNSKEDFVKKIRKHYPEATETFYFKDVRECFLDKYESKSIVEKFETLVKKQER